MIRRLTAWAGSEFDDGGDPARLRRSLALAVGATAGAGLGLELLLARLYPFLLGNISAFVAIPVAMFGLSVGALVLHLLPREPAPRWLPRLVLALALSIGLSFALCFLLFNGVDGFGLTHHKLQNPRTDALKTAVMALLFVPPFALVGLSLSTAFAAGSQQVGRLYAVDLAASAAACLCTPLLLHAVDLPVAICALLWVVSIAAARLHARAPRPVLIAGALMLTGLTILGARQQVFTERPDPAVMGVRYADGRTVDELRHRWNDVSRVALLRFFDPGPEGRTSWRLIHDDGISNVVVRRYHPQSVEDPPKPRRVHDLPFLLEHPPESALVIFAGAGQDMLRLYEQARGRLRVTGVELNGLVKSLVSQPGMDEFRLSRFYALPGVDLVIDEGRAYLNRHEGPWDLIFVASNGAQHAGRTGHSRKFLDTREAMATYLDRLAPGGLIVFNEQPIRFKLEVWKRLLARAGGPDFARCVIVLGRSSGPSDHIDTLLIRPDGFTAAEVATIRRTLKRGKTRIHYAPDAPGDGPYAAAVGSPPRPDAFVPTDDRPYERRIDWGRLDALPAPEQLASIAYSMDWIKAFTLVFFCLLAAASVAAFSLRARGGKRMPAWLAGWFLGTGLCYMQAQIGLMAKLELLLGRPLYSIAVVLAAFLLANGAGSAWVQRRTDAGRPPGLLGPCVAAAAAVPLTLLLVDALSIHALGLPTLLKVPVALASVAPLAFVLGMFYPLGVRMAVERGLGTLVPMTFGLATLSSVVGSTWAMVAVINLGFRLVVLQALLGYLLLAAIVAVFGRRASAGGPLAALLPPG